MSLKFRAMFKAVGMFAGLFTFFYFAIMIVNALTAAQIINAISLGLLAFAVYCLYQYFLMEMQNKEDNKDS